MASRRVVWLLVLLAVLGTRPALAQEGTDGGAAGQAGTPAPAGAVADAGLVTVLFRGLTPGDELRLGPVGGELAEQAVGEDGTAQVGLAPGARYDLRWGSAGREERLRFYVPKPADGVTPPAPVEVPLRPGLRALPARAWSGYAWAPGESERLAPPRPPAPRPAPRPAPEPARAPVPPPAPAPDLSGLATVESLQAAEEQLQGEAQSSRLLALLGLAVGLLGLAAGLGFYTAAWRPHRAAVAEALERALPDALRAQSQEAAALGRRLDAARQQWEHDRETLRRGQELLASHVAPEDRDPVREELARLRRENEDLRRQLAARGPQRGST